MWECLTEFYYVEPDTAESGWNWVAACRRPSSNLHHPNEHHSLIHQLNPDSIGVWAFSSVRNLLIDVYPSVANSHVFQQHVKQRLCLICRLCVRVGERFESSWIEWMPSLWPFNKMTYFSDRTLFFFWELAPPFHFFPTVSLWGYSSFVSRLIFLVKVREKSEACGFAWPRGWERGLVILSKMKQLALLARKAQQFAGLVWFIYIALQCFAI